MEQDRLDELVRYEVLAGLGNPDADVIVRHHVRRGVEESQVHAYSLPRAVVDDYRDRLSKHRISFDDLETPGFALASFVEAEAPSAGEVEGKGLDLTVEYASTIPAQAEAWAS